MNDLTSLCNYFVARFVCQSVVAVSFGDSRFKETQYRHRRGQEFDPEEEGATILRNVMNLSPNDKASYLGGLEHIASCRT